MNEINDSTRRILQYVVDQLRQGFTGRIELECHQGGIRDAREIRRLIAQDVDLTDDPIIR